MAHKNSHGDKLFYGGKEGKGCEVGADPLARVAKRVLQIRHHG